MKTPFFSVIIPTYNRGEDLIRCFESLKNQTYKNFEVLLCDDGSTDNTEEIVDLYKKELNILHIWDKNWGGPAKPRNNGIKIAKGEWICFLDSDDSWLPDKLEVVYNFTTDFDVIYHDLSVLNDPSNIINGRQFKTPVFDEIFKKNCILNSSACVRKSIISKTDGLSEDLDIVGVEDLDFWLKLAQVTNKFKYIPKILGVYNTGGGNLHHNVYHMYRGVLKVLNKYKSHSLYSECIRERYLHYLPFLSIFHKKEAFKIVRKIISIHPIWIMYVFLILIPKSVLLFFLKPLVKRFFKNYIYIVES